MSRPRGRSLLIGGLLSLGTVTALACAIDPPEQLLSDRNGSLKSYSANSFAGEVKLLFQAADARLKLQESGDNGYFSPDLEAKERAKERHQGLTDAQAAVLDKLGEDANGDAVLASDLPLALRLYTAGAIDFHHDRLDAALQYFQQVLALPEDQQTLRGCWAAYMIGRIALARADDAMVDKYFPLTRTLAAQGMDDPGLAVASFGEQARRHFRKAKALLKDDKLPPQAAADYSREMAAAVDLYGQQAAHDSIDAVNSLRIVGGSILTDRSTVAAAIDAPKIQRLLIAMTLAKFYANIPDPDLITPETEEQNNPPAKPKITAADLLALLAETSDQRRDGWLAAGDQLAALAYSQGQYAVARRFAEKSSGPLASWLKAKIALQDGDVAAATGFYAQAAKAFPENSLEPDNRQRLAGETGVLALARGEYLTALGYLTDNAPRYWGDIAHIADRVLTVDELKGFVDARAAAGNEALRDLLARRLARAGRIDEALPYFKSPDSAATAASYSQALKEFHTRWTVLGRAEAGYRAAEILHRSGMEIMGSEGDPDGFYWGGDFDGMIGQSAQSLDQAFVTAEERQRFAQSGAQPDMRFHYRFLAADQAVAAANFLPPRSQAFAAVLCNATGWMLRSRGRWQNEDDRAGKNKARDIYQLYVHQGALVPWANHFGRSCPAPDFNAAIGSMRQQWIQQSRIFIRRHWEWFAGGGFILGLAGFALKRRRVR